MNIANFKYIIAFCLLVLCNTSGSSQTAKELSDSTLSIDEVVVTGRLMFQEVIPSQKLSGEQLRRLSSHSIADAMRYFSGIQLKDYGGVGGVKTVNIRSMGSNHLGIYYDGIELGNAQNGQIDLGQFSLDNVEEISLYNGQKSGIFQTASDYGNAGSVYIRTRIPRFKDGEKKHFRIKLKTASSDLYSFSSVYEQRISNKVNASLLASALTSSGKYKFRYRRINVDGTTAWDTTATRQNGDIHAERIEANIYGRTTNGKWNAKAYLYNSQRGIPGAIVNNVWRRGERQGDLNTFIQAAWQKSFSERFSSRLMAKYAYYRTHYINRDTTILPVDNRYYQQEVYITTSNVYEILPSWSASLSYDLRWNKLNASTFGFAYPTRLSNLVSLATALDMWRIKMQASLLGSFINDWTKKNNIFTDDEEKSSKRHNSLSTLTPALFVNVYPFRSHVFSMRAFIKKSFRMPTFNDLYYTDLGNFRLKPESAIQYDFGFVVSKNYQSGLIRHFGAQVDGYYNTVHDKIIAYPKGQQFRWTMLNLGRVHIKGIDAQIETDLQPAKNLTITGRLQYTYQDARDVTNPSTPYYRDQIPYVPYNSGSAIIGINYKQWTANYSFIYAGDRYFGQENIIYNHIEPWYTSDVTLSYQGRWQRADWRITLEVNNLLSQDYDVIVNYPMPKRNYGLSVEIMF